MSAREAYIAGRSGAPRSSRPSAPKSGGPAGGPTREQKAYDAGQQERQRAQSIVENKGIEGLSQRNQEQAKTIAKITKKDPYNTLTREEQIDAGYPKTGIEKLQETTGTKIMSPTIQLMAGAGKGMQVLLDKIFKPSVEDFNDPVVLAAINRLFEEKKKELGEEGGNQFKKDYLKNYKDKLNEALTPQLPGFEQEQGFGILDEAGIASLFDDKLADAAAAAQSGALGKGVQRINFPKEFYMDDGKGIMPQTTDGLENLARLDTKGLEGTNPDLVKMIFNARAILDQNKGNQGGGGAGIPSLPQFQDKMDITKPSLSSQYSMIPEQYMGFFDSPFNKPVAGGMAITPVQLPDGSTIQFGDTGSAAQFQQYLDSIGVNYSNPGIVEKIANTPATGIPSLAPTSIDYASMGPQYGGYVNQGINDPRFASYFQNLQMFPRRS